jgi:hypothetical protein
MSAPKIALNSLPGLQARFTQPSIDGDRTAHPPALPARLRAATGEPSNKRFMPQTRRATSFLAARNGRRWTSQACVRRVPSDSSTLKTVTLQLLFP